MTFDPFVATAGQNTRIVTQDNIVTSPLPIIIDDTGNVVPTIIVPQADPSIPPSKE